MVRRIRYTFLMLAFSLLVTAAAPVRSASAIVFPGLLPMYAGWRVGHIVYDKIQDVVGTLDIRQTVMSAMASLMTDALAYIVLDRSIDEVVACTLLAPDMHDDAGNYIPPAEMSGTARSAEYWSSIYTDPNLRDATLAQLEDAYEEVLTYDPDVCDFTNSSLGNFVSYSRGSGSLLGMVNQMQRVSTTDNIPVNLASFTQHYARRIPIVRDTAFAADYNFPYATVTFKVWHYFRDVALGMLSLTMLVLGVMIMLRKKLSSQAVISVQTALPRIVIATVLVFFSWPLGALFASLVIPLIEASLLGHFGFFESAFSEIPASPVAQIIWNMSSILVLGGAGIVTIATVLLLLCGTFFALFILFFKASLLQFKIFARIMTGPLNFALSAIPGKEDSAIMWFKEMIADLLSIFAMFFMVRLAFFIAVIPYYTMTELYRGSGVSSAFPIFPALMGSTGLSTYILAKSFGMPKKVRAMIIGDKRR